jgi:hypothetical protein
VPILNEGDAHQPDEDERQDNERAAEFDGRSEKSLMIAFHFQVVHGATLQIKETAAILRLKPMPVKSPQKAKPRPGRAGVLDRMIGAEALDQGQRHQANNDDRNDGADGRRLHHVVEHLLVAQFHFRIREHR